MEWKVLIIVGDATETVDTLYPYYRLIEGGYCPVVAAPEVRQVSDERLEHVGGVRRVMVMFEA